MSRYIDGTWLLNFFVGIPDDYTLTVGNLRAVINDAPTAECFTCGMERVKDEKYGSLPTLVYDPEDVSDEVLETNDRLVRLADVCKLIKREWQINPHQWGELARLPSINLVRCKDCKECFEYDDGLMCIQKSDYSYDVESDDFCSRGVRNSSEKPNNCEHINEDGVTCAKYPACDDCPDNSLNKVKGSERLVKGSEKPNNSTISKMEQVQ